jgi:hypothetical protein
MYREIQNKEVKTRKPHYCGWCGSFMSVGSYARYRVYVFNGDFSRDWMHDDCCRAMQEISDTLPEGWSPGDFERGLTEMLT